MAAQEAGCLPGDGVDLRSWWKVWSNDVGCALDGGGGGVRVGDVQVGCGWTGTAAPSRSERWRRVW